MMAAFWYCNSMIGLTQNDCAGLTLTSWIHQQTLIASTRITSYEHLSLGCTRTYLFTMARPGEWCLLHKSHFLSCLSCFATNSWISLAFSQKYLVSPTEVSQIFIHSVHRWGCRDTRLCTGNCIFFKSLSHIYKLGLLKRLWRHQRIYSL